MGDPKKMKPAQLLSALAERGVQPEDEGDKAELVALMTEVKLRADTYVPEPPPPYVKYQPPAWRRTEGSGQLAPAEALLYAVRVPASGVPYYRVPWHVRSSCAPSTRRRSSRASLCPTSRPTSSPTTPAATAPRRSSSSCASMACQHGQSASLAVLPSSAPVPPQSAPCGSGQLGIPRKRPGRCGRPATVPRVLELAASKAADCTYRL